MYLNTKAAASIACSVTTSGAERSAAKLPFPSTPVLLRVLDKRAVSHGLKCQAVTWTATAPRARDAQGHARSASSRYGLP